MNVSDVKAEFRTKLLAAAEDASLPIERRKLALELVEHLATAPSTYAYEVGDMDADIETLHREMRAIMEARARWHVPQEFTNTIKSYPAAPSVPSGIIVLPTEDEELY